MKKTILVLMIITLTISVSSNYYAVLADSNITAEEGRKKIWQMDYDYYSKWKKVDAEKIERRHNKTTWFFAGLMFFGGLSGGTVESALSGLALGFVFLKIPWQIDKKGYHEKKKWEEIYKEGLEKGYVEPND